MDIAMLRDDKNVRTMRKEKSYTIFFLLGTLKLFFIFYFFTEREVWGVEIYGIRKGRDPDRETAIIVILR